MTGTVVGTFINKVITYHQGPGDYFQNEFVNVHMIMIPMKVAHPF